MESSRSIYHGDDRQWPRLGGRGIERHSTDITIFNAGPNKAFIDLHRPLERDRPLERELVRARRTNAVLGRLGVFFLLRIHG